MKVTVRVSSNLVPDTNPGREAIEFLAIEGYRAGTHSHHQASLILGLSRFQFDAFLKDRHIHERVGDAGDSFQDRATCGWVMPA